MREFTRPIPVPTPEERALFDAKYDRPEDGCWEWHAAKSSGYGRFRLGGVLYRAHRLLFAWTYPDIDITGRDLDHIVCDNRGCVRPTHVTPSTIKDNILRGESPSAVNARKTHCVRGHEFTPENTHVDEKGRRNCKECWRIRKREELERRGEIIRARKKAAYKYVSYEDRQCRTCGKTFTPKRSTNWYCSRHCQDNRKRDKPK